MFVRNNWYAAAWTEEVGQRQPLSRTVIGERLVLLPRAGRDRRRIGRPLRASLDAAFAGADRR